jgi:sarcosine oxidase, subunit beta
MEVDMSSAATPNAELPRVADAVVVGGGVMGTSTAYHLAARGMADVILLEREQFLGAMSTGQCAGGIRHQFASEINIRLSTASISMLERFPDELGQEIGLRFDGYLILVSSPANVIAFKNAIALQNRLGVATKWLEPDEVADMVPLLNLDGVLGGSFHDRDGLCDPSSVVQGYATGARRLGARIFTEAGVTQVDRRAGRFVVHTPRGAIETPVLINACGAWAPDIGRMLGVDIPIEPIRRQMVVTTPLPGVPEDFPFTTFFDYSLYFHREGEGILTGQSNPAQAPGFHLDIDAEWEAIHLENAMDRFPLLESAGVLSRWAGLYEVTPDAQAILGRVATVDGGYIMAGFSGHGFMHGPVAGLLMAEEVIDGAASTVDIRPFRYERFLEGSLTPEYNVI